MPHYLFYFGADEIDVWNTTEYTPLITYFFHCGCEFVTEPSGEFAEDAQILVCDMHYRVFTGENESVALH